MGNFLPTTNEALKRSNVKLQAQQVTSFKGEAIKWHSWKKKTRAAIGTAGMLQVLDNQEYANKHKTDNETIFHLLAVATADGSASHLVDQYEESSDGRKAYLALVNWYEGDELTTETAEDVRSKLDKLFLTTSNTASSYINDFQLYNKQLMELNESYTSSKTVDIFLSQIRDPDYHMTVETCLDSRLSLQQCIERTRAKERRLLRNKALTRKSNVSIRRNVINDSEKKTQEIDLNDYKTEKGFFSVPTNIWVNLSNKDREYIKKENGRHRKKREDSKSGQFSKDNGQRVTNRRLRGEDDNNETNTEFPETKKRKTLINENKDIIDRDHEITVKDDNKEITSRREVLNFKIKGINNE